MNDQEINEAIARKLGWERQIWKTPGNQEHLLWKRGSEERPSAPNYCVNIAAAWEIVEYLFKFEWAMELRSYPIGHEWMCILMQVGEKDILSESPTAPRAICLAFLKLP